MPKLCGRGWVPGLLEVENCCPEIPPRDTEPCGWSCINIDTPFCGGGTADLALTDNDTDFCAWTAQVCGHDVSLFDSGFINEGTSQRLQVRVSNLGPVVFNSQRRFGFGVPHDPIFREWERQELTVINGSLVWVAVVPREVIVVRGCDIVPPP